MESAKKKKREREKTRKVEVGALPGAARRLAGALAPAALLVGAGCRGGDSSGPRWVEMDGDRWGQVARGIGGSLLSLLPCFSPVQKEKKILSDLLGLPRES